MIRRGINRQKGVPPNQKQPMSIDVMKKMFGILDFAKSADLAFWAACCVGFFVFLRKSTLLPADSRTEGLVMLRREDVVDLEIDSFVLVVKKSKVIQFGERVHRIPFANCVLNDVCPVRAVLSHFGASVLGAKSPLFNYMQSGREVTLTQASFIVRLRGLLKALGLRSADYSAHSFRRGGASFAFSLGVSPLQIKLRGDWASDAYERYVFIQAGASMRVARNLCDGAALTSSIQV
jgi:hypothetical protein